MQQNTGSSLRKLRKLRKTATPYLYLLPALGIVSFIYFYPLLMLFNNSLFDVNLADIVAKRPSRFIGLENFGLAFSSEFLNSLVLTAVWTAVTVSASILLGLGIAMILNRDFKGRSVARILIIIPWAIPMSLSGIMWRWAYHPYYGMLNNILISAGIISQPIAWLSQYPLWGIILARIWRLSPVCTIYLLAGLQSIPKQINESAEVDGASTSQRFWQITLPTMLPVLAVTVLIAIMWTVNVFDMVWFMTGGGPGQATDIFAINIYKEAFVNFQLGLASAKSVIMIGILSLMTYLYIRTRRLS